MNYSLEWFKRSKGGRGGAENQANIVLRGFAIKGNRKGLIASRGYVFKKGAIVFIFFFKMRETATCLYADESDLENRVN